jgi:hypothetical protein
VRSVPTIQIHPEAASSKQQAAASRQDAGRFVVE